MKIDNLQKTEIQTVGDIKQIKASIDVENLDFITTLLSSNLYSQPMRSFLREIVSNAWDSHVEANTTDKPVIIKINANSVSIRDYGTGLSKSQFENLYCKIGSSTKRDSNSYIGCFGLGHLSPLAVSNIVYIKSYYNGVLRDYVMTKDLGTVTTNFLGESPTEEENGLQITVGNISTEGIHKELAYLAFFPNIYIDSNNIDNTYFNRATIKRFRAFSVASLLPNKAEMYILLGNVVYPLDTYKLPLYGDDKKMLTYLKEAAICINVNIGEISVTPNRESILYSEATCELLTYKVKAAIAEIKSIIAAKDNFKVNSIREYYNLIKGNIYWHPVTDIIDTVYTRGIVCEVPVFYKGKQQSEDFNDLVRHRANFKIPGFKYIMSQSGKFYTDKGIPYSLRYNINCISNKPIIAIEGNKSITGYTKKYLLSRNADYAELPIITRLSKQEFIRELGSNAISQNPEFKSFVEDLYKEVESRILEIPAATIDNYRVNNRIKRSSDLLKDRTLYTVHSFDSAFRSQDYCYEKPFVEVIRALKKAGKVILQRGRDTENFEPKYRVLQGLGYKILWVNISLYNKIIKYMAQRTNTKELNNVFLSPEIKYSNKEQMLIVLSKSINLYNWNPTDLEQAICIINRPEYSDFKKFIQEHKKSCASIPYNTEDIQLDYLALTFKNYLQEVNKVCTIISSKRAHLTYRLGSICREQVAFYKAMKKCIKKHLYVDLKYYKALKSDTIIQQLYYE